MRKMYSNISLKGLLKANFLIAVGLTIAGCMLVHGEVSSFSSLSPTTYGEQFFMLPNEEQATSVEFNQYASSVARRLEQKGCYRVMDSSKAKYFVLLDYGVVGSSKKTDSMPVYDQTGGGTTTHTGTFNTYGSGYGSLYGFLQRYFLHYCPLGVWLARSPILTRTTSFISK